MQRPWLPSSSSPTVIVVVIEAVGAPLGWSVALRDKQQQQQQLLPYLASLPPVSFGQSFSPQSSLSREPLCVRPSVHPSLSCHRRGVLPFEDGSAQGELDGHIRAADSSVEQGNEKKSVWLFPEG